MPTFAPHRLALATLLTLSLGAAWAQSSGDAVNGKALFDDTPGASGVSTLTGSCGGCHANSIQNRRAAVAGGSAQSPVISFDTALNKFGLAITNVMQMKQFQSLSEAQIQDIAAYIADTPVMNVTLLSFTATATNTMSANKTITITSPKAPLATVSIKSIAIAGTGVGNFGRTFECDNKVFTTAGSACSFGVYYSPKDTTASNPVVTITLKEGAGPDILRRVTLNGNVGGTPTTPPPATTPEASSGDSGGGAIGWAWLAGLAAATVALGARRRA